MRRTDHLSIHPARTQPFPVPVPWSVCFFFFVFFVFFLGPPFCPPRCASRVPVDMVASSIPSQHESTPRVDAIHRNSADTVLQSHSPGMAGQRSTDSAAKAKGAGEDPSLGSADPENAPEQQALGEKPQLHFRSHGLRDPQVRPMLLGILKGLGPMVAVLCLVVIWGLLPVYVCLPSLNTPYLAG